MDFHIRQVIADGSIHIYGTLRGRALAGMYGNGRARIFCRRLEAEPGCVLGNRMPPLDFVGGGVAHRFVRSEQDLAQRMQAMELGPDPDGRYRVNELFCYADTWQSAMRGLARVADAVVMDLRSFAEAGRALILWASMLIDRYPQLKVYTGSDKLIASALSGSRVPSKYSTTGEGTTGTSPR